MKTTKFVVQKMGQLIDDTKEEQLRDEIRKDYALLKKNNDWIMRTEMIKKYNL